jgi:hypothetical protein
MSGAAPDLRLAQELLDLLSPHGVRRLRLTRNRRVLLGLRGTVGRALTLSLHSELAHQRSCWPDLLAWVAGGGRQLPAALRMAMDEVFAAQQTPTVVPDLTPLGGPCDLQGIAERVHRTWFAHVPVVPVHWGRNAPGRSRRQIRFGSYRRRPPQITVHPLIDQPWVAERFVEYLLFHEYCHHAQACRPIPGEAVHSARFKTWEARYPHLAEVLAWEKAMLRRFLG